MTMAFTHLSPKNESRTCLQSPRALSFLHARCRKCSPTSPWVQLVYLEGPRASRREGFWCDDVMQDLAILMLGCMSHILLVIQLCF